MSSKLQIWRPIPHSLLRTIRSSIKNPNVSTPVKESAKDLIHELEVEPKPHEKDPARVAAGFKAYEFLHRGYSSFLTFIYVGPRTIRMSRITPSPMLNNISASWDRTRPIPSEFSMETEANCCLYAVWILFADILSLWSRFILLTMKRYECCGRRRN